MDSRSLKIRCSTLILPNVVTVGSFREYFEPEEYDTLAQKHFKQITMGLERPDTFRFVLKAEVQHPATRSGEPEP